MWCTGSATRSPVPRGPPDETSSALTGATIPQSRGNASSATYSVALPEFRSRMVSSSGDPLVATTTSVANTPLTLSRYTNSSAAVPFASSSHLASGIATDSETSQPSAGLLALPNGWPCDGHIRTEKMRQPLPSTSIRGCGAPPSRGRWIAPSGCSRPTTDAVGGSNSTNPDPAAHRTAEAGAARPAAAAARSSPAPGSADLSAVGTAGPGTVAATPTSSTCHSMCSHARVRMESLCSDRSGSQRRSQDSPQASARQTGCG